MSGVALAAATPGIELPPGEEVLELAWHDAGGLVLVVAQDTGFAVRRLELASSDLLVVSAPRGFTNVRQGSTRYVPEFYLAPNGSALAVLERAVTPLVPHDLSVYRIEGEALAPVSTRQIPREFWPEHVRWQEDGSGLYMSARHFLFPEQAYSLGRLDADSGAFNGVALRANVDLVDELVWVPQRGALAVRCRGYHGDYPAQSMVVLIDPYSNDERMLHSRADNLRLHVLSSGQLLLVAASPHDAGESQPAAPESGSQEWILGWDETTLRRARCAVGESVGGLQASADGSWLGFVAGPVELGMVGEPTERYLALQRSRDGRTLLTAEPCSGFVFSPAGTQVCAVSPEGNKLYFYVMPQ